MTSAAIQNTLLPVSGDSFVHWLHRTREGLALGTPLIALDRANVQDVDPMGSLLARVAGGDRGAFRQLYDLAAPQLFGIALNILRRRDHAEDLLQDAFLAIWQKAAQFTPERGTPMGWMVMIVRYRAIDRMRLAKRRPQETDIERAPPSEPVLVESPRDAGRDVCHALATLPETHRRAVTLAFVEGLTHEELALRLNAPLGTVKSWVRRGLRAMKETLNT